MELFTWALDTICRSCEQDVESQSVQVGSYGLWAKAGYGHEAQGEDCGVGRQVSSIQQQHHPHHNQ